MKRSLKVILIAILCIVLICCLIAYAHPGRTDQNGGHYNHSTGEYHYHHGKPEHLHTNGECPYGIPKIFGKIFIFLAGAITIPLSVNMIIFGIVFETIDSISSKFKKKREQKEKSKEDSLMSEQKADKPHAFFSITLYIIEVVIWAIIIINW